MKEHGNQASRRGRNSAVHRPAARRVPPSALFPALPKYPHISHLISPLITPFPIRPTIYVFVLPTPLRMIHQWALPVSSINIKDQTPVAVNIPTDVIKWADEKQLRCWLCFLSKQLINPILELIKV